MKQLSSAMTKLLFTDKDTSQEKRCKLCEITSEHTECQDYLIEMASKFSANERFSEDLFKKLGDLGLNFKSAEGLANLSMSIFERLIQGRSFIV